MFGDKEIRINLFNGIHNNHFIITFIEEKSLEETIRGYKGETGIYFIFNP